MAASWLRPSVVAGRATNLGSTLSTTWLDVDGQPALAVGEDNV